MNTTDRDHDAGGPDAREWAAQERARREAGTGGRAIVRAADHAPDDAGAAAYRRIAEALRNPPPVELPADFAARVARTAEAPRRTPAGPAFENILQRVLVVAFALCAVLAGLAYGARLLALLQAGVGADALQWAALAAACVALSWSFEWLRNRAGRGGDSLRAA